MDQIHITDIHCYGYTGYLPEEQVLGQWFAVDVTLWLDLAQASTSDRLQDTLDYRAVITTVKAIVSTAKFALVERLAGAIAQAILEPTEPCPVAVEQVRVCLSKLAAPIPDFGGKITVEITRSRSQNSDT